MNSLYAIVLAAGKGKRMRSDKHKVLHPICGKPMIEYILHPLEEMNVQNIILVVGHLAETIREQLGDSVTYVEQREQKGTAHAVLQAKSVLQGLTGYTFVLNGDHPLLTEETLYNLLVEHKQTSAAATLLTAELDDPTGYGRIVRNADGSVSRIVEHNDATSAEQAIKEVNMGTYIFDNEQLFTYIEAIENDNSQGEYYLPDIFPNMIKSGLKVFAQKLPNQDEAMGINDRIQLAEAAKLMQRRINREHMLNGVTIVDPDSTYIESDVIIGPDTLIEPGTYLRGKTVVGGYCQIGPQADLRDVVLQHNVKISYSTMSECCVEDHTEIGPYAYIRPGTTLATGVKVGCFVDLKKAHIDVGSKISHHAYVGDAEIGKNVNISCGVITVNYDGKNKYKTIVEDHSFIGCNVNLIAPINVGENSYIAAGSTINKDVPKNGFAIARERQTIKPDYAKKLLARLPK